MAAEIVCPTDAETGLPHLVLPYDVPEDRIDYHHHFFPRRSPELYPMAEPLPSPENMKLEDLASLSLRISRGQLLPRSIHEAAHKKMLGPTLPQTLDDKFTTTVKACSGLVSRWAVDIRRPDDDMLVYMDDDTFAKAADKRTLCSERLYYDRPATYRRQVFGNFFLRYALSQKLDCLSPSIIDQFLETKDDGRRRELGNFILKEALRARIEPVLPVHRRMVQQGNVQPGRPGIVTVVRKLIPKESIPRYYPVIAEKLLAA